MNHSMKYANGILHIRTEQPITPESIYFNGRLIWWKDMDMSLRDAYEKGKEVGACINQENMHVKTTDGLISRQLAIDAVNAYFGLSEDSRTIQNMTSVQEILENLPSVEPSRKKGTFTIDEVAMILSNAFGDECACNFNGIDEWLPQSCKYAEIADECPYPSEKNGCWKQFLIQGGADMRGEEES